MFGMLKSPTWENETGTGTPPPPPQNDNPPAEPDSDPAPADLISGGDDGETTEGGPKTLDGEDFTSEAFTALFEEGTEIDETTAGEFLSLVNTSSTKEDLAAGMAKLYQTETARVVEQVTDQLTSAWNDTQTAMQDEMRNDATLGGDALKGNLVIAKEVVEEFGGKEALEALKTTGFGNSLAALKLFTAIRKALPGEGDPNDQVQPQPKKKSLADQMFSTST